MLHSLLLYPPNKNWYMHTISSSHITRSQGNLPSYFNMSNLNRFLVISNGNKISILGYGYTLLQPPFPALQRKHVLHSPNLVKNLIYVCRLTIDNNISIEFDAFGFSMKAYPIRTPNMRCNCNGDLVGSHLSIGLAGKDNIKKIIVYEYEEKNM